MDPRRVEANCFVRRPCLPGEASPVHQSQQVAEVGAGFPRRVDCRQPFSAEKPMDPIDVRTALAALPELYPPKLIQEVLQATEAELVSKQRVLQQALADGDEEGLRRAAHSLKSTSGAIRLEALMHLAAAVERAPAQDLPAQTRQLLDGVQCTHAVMIEEGSAT